MMDLFAACRREMRKQYGGKKPGRPNAMSNSAIMTQVRARNKTKVGRSDRDDERKAAFLDQLARRRMDGGCLN